MLRQGLRGVGKSWYGSLGRTARTGSRGAGVARARRRGGVVAFTPVMHRWRSFPWRPMSSEAGGVVNGTNTGAKEKGSDFVARKEEEEEVVAAAADLEDVSEEYNAFERAVCDAYEAGGWPAVIDAGLMTQEQVAQAQSIMVDPVTAEEGEEAAAAPDAAEMEAEVRRQVGQMKERFESVDEEEAVRDIMRNQGQIPHDEGEPQTETDRVGSASKLVKSRDDYTMVMETWHKMEESLQRGAYEEAYMFVRRLINKPTPWLPVADLEQTAGTCLMAMSKESDAEKHFVKAIEHRPGFVLAIFHTLHIRREDHDYEGILQLVEEQMPHLIEVGTADAMCMVHELLFYRAQIQQGEGDVDAAIDTYWEALAYEPDNSQTLTILANTLLERQQGDDEEEAFALLSKAAESVPVYAEALHVLSQLMGQRGNQKEADELLMAYLDLNARDASKEAHLDGKQEHGGSRLQTDLSRRRQVKGDVIRAPKKEKVYRQKIYGRTVTRKKRRK